MINAQKITRMGRMATSPEAVRLWRGLVGCVQGMDEYREKSEPGAENLTGWKAARGSES
jgi:hypothetical protein